MHTTAWIAVVLLTAGGVIQILTIGHPRGRRTPLEGLVGVLEVGYLIYVIVTLAT
jgi:hypothetical protein